MQRERTQKSRLLALLLTLAMLLSLPGCGESAVPSPVSLASPEVPSSESVTPVVETLALPKAFYEEKNLVFWDGKQISTHPQSWQDEDYTAETRSIHLSPFPFVFLTSNGDISAVNGFSAAKLLDRDTRISCTTYRDLPSALNILNYQVFRPFYNAWKEKENLSMDMEEWVSSLTDYKILEYTASSSLKWLDEVAAATADGLKPWFWFFTPDVMDIYTGTLFYSNTDYMYGARHVDDLVAQIISYMDGDTERSITITGSNAVYADEEGKQQGTYNVVNSSIYVLVPDDYDGIAFMDAEHTGFSVDLYNQAVAERESSEEEKEEEEYAWEMIDYEEYMNQLDDYSEYKFYYFDP